MVLGVGLTSVDSSEALGIAAQVAFSASAASGKTALRLGVAGGFLQALGMPARVACSTSTPSGRTASRLVEEL